MEVCDEALGVTPGRTTSSADLGGKFLLLFSSLLLRMYANFFSRIGSSKYSNENFED